MRIPAALDEITPAWLTAALSARHPGVRVVGCEASGFFGHKPNKARVRLAYDAAHRIDGLPETLIVKGGFKRDDTSATLSGLDIGLELELLAYQELTEHLDARTPRCHFVQFDAERYDGIMLIEDLAPQGAVFMNGRSCLDYDEAAAFARAMAHLHAPWLGSAELGEGGRFGPDSRLAERTMRIQRQYFDRLTDPEHWTSLMMQPRGAALPRRLQDVARMDVARQRMNEALRECPLAIVHGDEHLGNLYFDAQGNAGFIDWCSRREAWVVSYAYFIVSTLDVLDRRDWERTLLQVYLEELRRLDARTPGFEEAWRLYRQAVLFPCLAWINNSAKWQPEAVNTRNAQRGAWAVVDHDTLALLGA